MPSRASKHFFHKNRSQASFLTSTDANGGRDSYQASPIDSPLHSPAFPPPRAAAPHDESDQLIGYPYPEEDPKPSPWSSLARSHSQTSQSVQTYTPTRQQPTVQLVGPHTGQPPIDSSPSTIDEDPDAYYHQAPTARPQKEESKRRRFFGLGSSSKEPHTSAPASTPVQTQRLGRSISVRTKNYSSQSPVVSAGRPAPQRWPSESSGSTYPPQASEEDDEGGGGLPLTGPAPPIPNKDPSRPLDFSTTNVREGNYRRPSVQSVVTENNGRQYYSRQGSATSATWDSPQSLHQQQRVHQDLHQIPPSYHPSPSSATSASSHQLSVRGQQEPHHLHHHREQQHSRPSSQQSHNPPSPTHSHPPRFESHGYSLAQTPASATSQNAGSMGPPQTQPSRDRRSQELAQPQQNQQAVGGREGGGYQPYHQGSQSQGQPQGPPPAYSSQLGLNNQQGNGYRGSQAPPMSQQNTGEQGRNTPPLQGRQDKYRKVKKYYFDKEAQVQTLQNTLAHQRLAQSRTSLDDN
ncbi:MAG: hypothetical protein Q9174_002762, partial [Haloplaca sp. 1 TL-2023]